MSAQTKPVVISGAGLQIDDVVRVARFGVPVRLTDDAEVLRQIEASCAFVAEAVRRGDALYGVTTALGGMADIVISQDEAARLQANALWVHKTGIGERIPTECVRATMLLRANSHMKGASGIRLALIRRLETFLNAGVTPHVYEFGSIGASGDLVPMAAITGTIIGLDRRFTADFEGASIDAVTVLERLGLPPLRLEPKEALAMMNGTSASTGVAAVNVHDTRELLEVTLATHALFVQALAGTNQSFHPFIARMKPHGGQVSVAARILELILDSRLIRNELSGEHEHLFDDLIQDRYSLRCLPQYLGPIVEGIASVAAQIEVEINSASDNPLIDVESGESYHGGNFLGEYVGIGMDQLRSYIGLVAKHLDVQIAMLVTPAFNRGLPPSLVGNADNKINMGLKGLQLTANSMVPMLAFLGNSIVDRFPTHAEQFNQNINSQSFGSANLARRSVDVFRHYLAVAIVFATQAVDLRTRRVAGHFDARACLSPKTIPIYQAIRDTLETPPSRERPLIWNDDDQALDELVARVHGDLKAGRAIYGAFEQLPSGG